jgi:uncharacterized protein (TIGR01777 family)
MQVAISGASGLVGTALSESLRDDGHRVLRLVRAASDGPDAIQWDPLRKSIDGSALDGVDAVVHLAGAGIGDHRWSARHRQAIRESRTKGTALIARTLADLDHPPKVLISASGMNAYGDGGDKVLTETSPAGEGFLADLVAAWEQAAKPAEAAGVRTVFARSSMVLSRRGGALVPMLRLFRLGLGGRLGSGKQWMSWISLTDELGALRFLLDHDVTGPVNLTAPNPVTNREFTKALGEALHRPAVLPIPRFGPRLVLGRDMADELLFASLRVHPAVLEAAGFQFAHPDIRSGLEAALRDEAGR